MNKGRFIKLHSLHGDTQDTIDICIHSNRIRFIEAVYADHQLYDRGVRSMISVSVDSMLCVTETPDEILRLIEEV